MLTILCYSLFTFLCGFVTTIWQLAALRVLCGIGIGGEQPVGAAYIAESLSEDQRKIGAGLMHTGYYFGFFAAAVINYFVGATYGWRVMFMVGGVPALLIGFIRYGVSESPAWQQARMRRADLVRSAPMKRPRMRDAFATLFAPEFRSRTFVMSVLFLISILGFWGGSTYVPAAVTQIARRGGMGAPDAARMASYGSMLLAAGTIIGCVIIPFVAERIGRRWATMVFFLITMVAIAASFGHVFYLQGASALPLFLTLMFVLGIGGANVAIYTIWLPEQFPTDCRASAIAFISSIGRFVAVAAVFVVGAGIARYGSIGVPVALMALLYLLGIVLLPFTVETRGRALPL
jgi:MFS family permease